jgi:hypothetical protein
VTPFDGAGRVRVGRRSGRKPALWLAVKGGFDRPLRSAGCAVLRVRFVSRARRRSRHSTWGTKSPARSWLPGANAQTVAERPKKAAGGAPRGGALAGTCARDVSRKSVPGKRVPCAVAGLANRKRRGDEARASSGASRRTHLARPSSSEVRDGRAKTIAPVGAPLPRIFCGDAFGSQPPRGRPGRCAQTSPEVFQGQHARPRFFTEQGGWRTFVLLSLRLILRSAKRVSKDRGGPCHACFLAHASRRVLRNAPQHEAGEIGRQCASTRDISARFGDRDQAGRVLPLSGQAATSPAMTAVKTCFVRKSSSARR